MHATTAQVPPVTAREHVRHHLEQEMTHILKVIPQISAHGMAQLIRQWTAERLISPDITTDIEKALAAATDTRTHANGHGTALLVKTALKTQ